MLNSVAADEAAIDAYLARFVPRYRRGLPKRREGGRPAAERSNGVVLYIDIAGFTALTGELTRTLAVGAEQVALDVNRVLSGIAQIAARHGGEVMHFAGDAAWIAWLAPSSEEIGEFCTLAALTAVAVRQASQGWTFASRPVGLRSSIGSGAVDHFEVGGHRGQWVGLLDGEAIAEAVRADKHAVPGSIVVSPTAWPYLEGVCAGTDVGDRCMRIDVPPDAPRPPAGRAGEAIDEDLGAFLPPMVVFHAQNAHREAWAGEFRTGHVVFGRLRGADAVGDVERLHAMVAEVQRQFDHSDGGLYQVLTDEKGVAIIGVHGLPPRVHAGDAGRALDLALSLETALSQLGFDVRVGVATGRLFCTVYGTGDQLQFALVGPALNLAARLAEGREAVVTDAETVEAAALRPPLIARRLPPRILRGIAEAVAAFEIYKRPEQTGIDDAADQQLPALVGREEELARCVTSLDRLADGAGGLLVIEGEPGVGKSTLAQAVVGAARARRLRCIGGDADEIERTTDYLVWRRVLRDAVAPGATGSSRVPEEAFRVLGANREHAPLLSHLLDLDLGSSAGDGRLSDEGRAEIVRRMAIDLLAAVAKQAPMVVVLEDMQWFDTASLVLLRGLLEADLPILAVITRRPGAGDGQMTQLLDGPRRQTIALGGLGVEPTSALLAKVCSAQQTDVDLAGRVHALTGGNPFFISQVGRFLLDHGKLRVWRGEVVPLDDNVTLDEAFKAFGVPATLEGVVMGRLDQLAPAERQIVRICSVFGRTFDGDDVAALLGRTAPAQPDFAGLIASGILAATEPGGFGFRHAILRDVAYSSLSMADRQQLHAAAARRLSARQAAGDADLDAVLAHHWERARELPAAVTHLLRAGTTALHNNANQEALALHVRGLALLDELPEDGQASLRQTGIALEFGAGEAAQRLSHYDIAARHKDAALAALGAAVPSGAAVIPAIVREIAVQIARRRFPALAARLGRPTPLRLRISAETAELVEIYFYSGQSLRSFYAALRSLNLAEGGGDTPQLARGFGIVGTMAGFARLSGVAKRYGQRALDILSRIDDPTAAWWVPLVVGVSRLSAGELTASAELLEMTAAAAERIHDRRHWRDAIENLGIIAALRGNWPLALERVAAYRATAVEDKDARYVVAALREQAYCLLQLGRIEECERGLALLRAELARGPRAEDAASRQDLHAMAAAVAMKRGDLAFARTQAHSALAAAAEASGGTSFPNMFWSLSVLFDVLIGLAGRADDAAADAWRRKALIVCRALDRHAASHAVGRPAALRARGAYELRFGRGETAKEMLDDAAIVARQMGMSHEVEPAGPASSDAAPTAALSVAAVPAPHWLRRRRLLR